MRDQLTIKWYEDKYQVSTYTGNLAWVMIALLSYYEQQGGSEYLGCGKRTGRVDILQNLRYTRDGGFNGGYEGWERRTKTLQDLQRFNGNQQNTT